MGETSVTGEPAEVPQPGAADGRIHRAARTRAAVVDALLTLNDEGILRPTARDIAAKAGVSLRSLYVHFDDLEALFVAAAKRHAERMADRLPPLVTTGDLADRLDGFIRRRVCLNEMGAGVRRAAQLQEPFSPALQGALASGRKRLRAEVKAAFGPELEATTTSPGCVLDALDIVASPATWEALRTHQSLSVDEATGQVRDMILAFLDSWTSADAVVAAGAPTATGATGTAEAGGPPVAGDVPDRSDHPHHPDRAGPQG
jgi:TetR/AcrR family transcriptional regulator, regulator of autoinduction and epiphytic fitness